MWFRWIPTIRQTNFISSPSSQWSWDWRLEKNTACSALLVCGRGNIWQTHQEEERIWLLRLQREQPGPCSTSCQSRSSRRGASVLYTCAAEFTKELRPFEERYSVHAKYSTQETRIQGSIWHIGWLFRHWMNVHSKWPVLLGRSSPRYLPLLGYSPLPLYSLRPSQQVLGLDLTLGTIDNRIRRKKLWSSAQISFTHGTFPSVEGGHGLGAILVPRNLCQSYIRSWAN